MMKRGNAVLQIVAIEVVNSKHTDFLKHMAQAWLKADRGNRAIVKPAWLILVNQYGLEKEYAESIETHLEEYIGEAEA